MNYSQYLARPDQTLASHLDGVVENVIELVPSGAETPDRNSLRKLIKTVAHLHDIGKLTTPFQEYVHKQPNRPPRPEEYHARVGAFLTLHALGVQGFEPNEAIAGFYAVLKHHGVLPNIQESHTSWTTRDQWTEPLANKLENIDDHANDSANKRLKRATDGDLTWASIPVENPLAYRNELNHLDVEESDFYTLLLRIWSTLTCADKLDAADPSLTPTTKRPEPDVISFESDATGVKKRLNEHRSDARKNARKRLLAQADDQQMFTLTLPTGFGKTAAGLEAALTLAEERDGRVIYGLPYTTVLDQVHEVIMEQFSVKPTSNAYTLHYHLEETRTTKDSEGEPLADGTEALYGETWQAGLVLTTFVQLFESLAGPGNVQSIKLPALQDTVVIVDEPQALPKRWWHLISRLSTILTEEYDATLIFMTATQPRFINEYNFQLDSTELIPDVDRNFEFLETNERVRFIIDASVSSSIGNGTEQPKSPSDAAGQILRTVENTAMNVLAVNNTIKSAADLGTAISEETAHSNYNSVLLGDHLKSFVEQRSADLIEAVQGDDELDKLATEFLNSSAKNIGENTLVVGTLTAALRPCDRSLLIEALQQIVDSGTTTPFDTLPVVVASTQLVEAGVDVSFDHVYRDFAPVPSLVQAAGRCNRSFEDKTGQVTIWLLDGNSELPSEIYTRQGDFLQPGRDSLRDAISEHGHEIPEAVMIQDVVDDYYGYLYRSDHTTDRKDSLVTAVDAARGEELRNASLIDDYTEDVLVLFSDADCDILKEYLKYRSEGDYEKAKQSFGSLKHLFASVPVEQSSDVSMTNEVLTELGFSGIDLEEFEIIDSCEKHRYDLVTGNGLRDT